MQNRRKEPRRRLFYFPEIRFQKSRSLAGYLYDVTSGGLKLRSIESFAIGQSCAFEMAFPDNSPPPRLIHFSAECRWSSPQRNGVPCSYGFQITTIEGTDLQLLKQLIEAYALPDELD